MNRRNQHNGFNQLLSVASTDGRLTSFSYDGNGNQVAKTDAFGSTTYAYNYDNRLVDIAGPSGSSHFEYDANGLRTKKTDSTGTRSYLLDGLSVVAEYAPDASRLAWYTQSLARIDEVLSVVNTQGKYWYETDALGSTYAMTNAAGAVVSRSAYDVFGERALVAGSDFGQTIGFTGREHDPGSGLVYARARYLRPAVGLWTRPDPLGMVESPHRYDYVRAKPALLADPTGLFATELHNRIIESALQPLAVSSYDIESLKVASAKADSVMYQGSDAAFRHAMRPQGQSVDEAIRLWATFVVKQVALAAEIASACPDAPGSDGRTKALLELGFGMHAVMDMYSPWHRFFVWSNANARDHITWEKELTISSPFAQQAVGATARYWQSYEQLKKARRAGGDSIAWAIMLFGREAYLEGQWMSVQDPPGW